MFTVREIDREGGSNREDAFPPFPPLSSGGFRPCEAGEGLSACGRQFFFAYGPTLRPRRSLSFPRVYCVKRASLRRWFCGLVLRRTEPFPFCQHGFERDETLSFTEGTEALYHPPIRLSCACNDLRRRVHPPPTAAAPKRSASRSRVPVRVPPTMLGIRGFSIQVIITWARVLDLVLEHACSIRAIGLTPVLRLFRTPKKCRSCSAACWKEDADLDRGPGNPQLLTGGERR